MIENILVGAAVIWAAAYVTIKTVDFFRKVKTPDSPKCSCTSCPYMKS